MLADISSFNLYLVFTIGCLFLAGHYGALYHLNWLYHGLQPVSRKSRALLLCLHVCFFCFGPIGLVRTTDQLSRLYNQPRLTGQACLHNRLAALA